MKCQRAVELGHLGRSTWGAVGCHGDQNQNVTAAVPIIMSLAKLTALSTQTLSLLLERQRLRSLTPAVTEDATNISLHLPQITHNLALLRSGILELESTGDHSEAAALMRNQHVRMRGMVGSDAVIESLPEPTTTQEDDHPPAREKPQHAWPAVDKQAFTPYTDDPEAGRDPVSVLQEQQRLMDGACRAPPPRFYCLLLSGIVDYRPGCTSGFAFTLDHTSA